MIVNDLSTSGMLPAMVRPCATSRSFASAMNGPRLIVTLSPCALMAPPCSPDSSATSCLWASSLALSQAVANESEATIWAIRPRTKFSIAAVSGALRPCSCAATSGDRPRRLSAVSPCAVSSATSIRVKISVVIASVMASCRSGLSASGDTVST